jgi:hypothetical protein
MRMGMGMGMRIGMDEDEMRDIDVGADLKRLQTRGCKGGKESRK